MQSDLKALLFDLDGTLYVSIPLGRDIRAAACRYIAELKGIGVEQANLLLDETKKRLSALSGLDTPLSLACGELGGDLLELHRRFAVEVRPERYLSRDNRVVELLKTLGGKFELYLYTNNNRPLTDAIMDLIGIAGLFRGLFTIEDSWRPKPNREALAEILRRIGRRPDECLFVGDRYDVDLRLPAEMGCAVFLVNSTEELFPLCRLMSEENI
ncbi:MAG: HAD family hydrolase [Geobacteraceae bacterium]|nr:HAD family hydrolase [Geobacteraceae bacterium]